MMTTAGKKAFFIVSLILFSAKFFTCGAMHSTSYAVATITIVHHICMTQLWSITAENKYRSASKSTIKKTEVKKPVALNTEGLPTLKEILEGLQLSQFFPNFVKMGVVETRFLLRLSPMDYRMMSLEWEGFTTEHLAKLKEETAALIAKATVTEQLSSSKADYALRNKQKYGRIYIENSVQSYEFVVATFGGAPPLGKLPILVPDSVIGCEALNESQANPNLNYERKVVVVRRGECSFLTKALNAKKFNASALIIVNTEDILEPPASGYGIDKNVTEASVLSLGTFPILAVANTSWAKIAATIRFTAPLQTYIHIVPLYCKSGGVCGPATQEEKSIQSEVQCGIIRTTSSEGEVRSFDFLTSNFGSTLPVQGGSVSITLANPIDACEALIADRAGYYDGKVVVAHRGQCRFDKKALVAQEAGARLLLVMEVDDLPLQRIGGYQPDAGYVFIPSILVTAPHGRQLELSLRRNVTVSAQIIPSKDNKAADSWIDLAFTTWSEDENELLVQIEGLVQKYSQMQHQEIVAWLRRKQDNILKKNQKPMETDEINSGDNIHNFTGEEF